MKAIIEKEERTIVTILEDYEDANEFSFYDPETMLVINNIPQYAIDNWEHYYYKDDQWLDERKVFRKLTQREIGYIKEKEKKASDKRKESLSNDLTGTRDDYGASEKAVGLLNAKVETNKKTIAKMQSSVNYGLGPIRDAMSDHWSPDGAFAVIEARDDIPADEFVLTDISIRTRVSKKITYYKASVKYRALIINPPPTQE
ncbi:hypothetical protein [Vibrio coralliilyticus]|uniref:hypothetical protein n=1 Tax=Vibrio coralliilyticus TaxID=190893 RepID=UPI0017D1B853|nr:hypothetical protein [Vibrio coralliilyticus]NUW69543.1 hypothetical protein [Vibrio coralliilyticus]